VSTQYQATKGQHDGHGSGRRPTLAITSAVLTHDDPLNIWTQFLAQDRFALFAREPFHGRTMFRGELPSGVQPRPDVAPVAIPEENSQGRLTAKNCRSTMECGFFRG